jgi:hypothetical protein
MHNQAKIQLAYEDIARYLKEPNGLCTLVLGPDLAVNQQGVSHRVFFRKLGHDYPAEINHYFERENLFSFVDNTGRKRNRSRIKDFYNDCGDTVLLDMIARIRFPLIINVSPDISLNKLYQAKGIPFQEGYFTSGLGDDKGEMLKPSKALPVIYNMFGQVEPDTSLILEHSKLYETVQDLLPADSLPEGIEGFLRKCSSFILLGFKFDSWQYQLMCHKLQLKGDSKVNLSTPAIEEETVVSVVMNKHFEIEFANDNPAQAIEKIIALCGDSPQALRPKDPNSSYSLFVSYAWANPDAPDTEPNRETVVDWLQKQSALVNEQTLLFFRDHTDLGYGESIDSFMTRIGKGKTVIRVISDKYLKSRYCMTEAMRIDRYQDEEERIFTLVWHDANLDLDKGLLVYREHWKEKCQRILEDLTAKLDNDGYDSSVAIYRFLPRFFKLISDRVHLHVRPGDFEYDTASAGFKLVESRRADYEAFVQAIIQKIKES